MDFTKVRRDDLLSQMTELLGGTKKPSRDAVEKQNTRLQEELK